MLVAATTMAMAAEMEVEAAVGDHSRFLFRPRLYYV